MTIDFSDFEESPNAGCLYRKIAQENVQALSRSTNVVHLVTLTDQYGSYRTVRQSWSPNPNPSYRGDNRQLYSWLQNLREAFEVRYNTPAQAMYAAMKESSHAIAAEACSNQPVAWYPLDGLQDLPPPKFEVKEGKLISARVAAAPDKKGNVQIAYERTNLPTSYDLASSPNCPSLDDLNSTLNGLSPEPPETDVKSSLPAKVNSKSDSAGTAINTSSLTPASAPPQTKPTQTDGFWSRFREEDERRAKKANEAKELRETGEKERQAIKEAKQQKKRERWERELRKLREKQETAEKERQAAKEAGQQKNRELEAKETWKEAEEKRIVKEKAEEEREAAENAAAEEKKGKEEEERREIQAHAENVADGELQRKDERRKAKKERKAEAKRTKRELMEAKKVQRAAAARAARSEPAAEPPPVEAPPQPSPAPRPAPAPAPASAPAEEVPAPTDRQSTSIGEFGHLPPEDCSSSTSEFSLIDRKSTQGLSGLWFEVERECGWEDKLDGNKLRGAIRGELKDVFSDLLQAVNAAL